MQRGKTMRIWIIAGTRPEIVKLAPVYRALKNVPAFSVKWIHTGQHTSLADQAYASLEIAPDLAIDMPRTAGAGVANLLGKMTVVLDAAMATGKPDFVVVQGDTTSAAAACLAAFGNQIPVGHVEAGLRTYDLMNPFPEEAWRVVIGSLASLHFAPTPRAADNLLREGHSRDRVSVTGNTVIDALQWLADGHLPREDDNGRRKVLITLHRRENWNGPLERICGAIRDLAEQFDDIDFQFVAHANPDLRKLAEVRLTGIANIQILDPMDYPDFLSHMRQACLILTDSGGVQEEAPAFGVPVLVVRTTTERPEAVEAGVAVLVGTIRERIRAAASELLNNEQARRSMARIVSPFGDGLAAPRIAQQIEAFLNRGTLAMTKAG